MADVKPGEGTYKVIGGVAVVRLLDGSERYLYKNARFDAAGADAASVEHLTSVGLIEPVPVAPSEDESAFPEGDPSEEWSGKQLDAYAAAKGIELGSAKTKAEKVAALVAASAE